jgi:FAD/FMN-containing dehydrogenase
MCRSKLIYCDSGDVSVAGGWAQGGGHSYLSGEYGLGADMVLEYKVIDAKGDLVVANAVTNQDLFWALRGGGGGTFGVVVEATFKVGVIHCFMVNFYLTTRISNV